MTMTPQDHDGAADAPEQRAERGSSYFLWMAWLALALALTGFAKTFFVPVMGGTFKGSLVFYVHGALVFSWLALFVVQSLLIRSRRVSSHRLLGWLAVLLVPSIVVFTLAVGVAALKRDLAMGHGGEATSSLVGVVTAMIWFLVLVSLAIVYRRRTDFHKRLMLLATISILWPATFRFRHYFPSIPHPEIIFALILPGVIILGAMLRDKLAFGRVHIVYQVAGLTLMAEQIAEVVLYDSSSWRHLAQWLAGFFL